VQVTEKIFQLGEHALEKWNKFTEFIDHHRSPGPDKGVSYGRGRYFIRYDMHLYGAGLQSAVARTGLSLLPVGMENCAFSFLAEGPVGGNFSIQTSSNLQQWVTILTNTMPPNGSVLNADPSACNSNPRFYRGALTD